MDAFNRKGARLLEAIKQGNHPILVEDPSLPIFAKHISARILTHARSNHSMEVYEFVVNPTNDDVLQKGSMLPEVLSLPPPTTGSW